MLCCFTNFSKKKVNPHKVNVWENKIIVSSVIIGKPNSVKNYTNKKNPLHN